MFLRNYIDRFLAKKSKIPKRRNRIFDNDNYNAREHSAPFSAPKWTLAGYNGKLEHIITEACKEESDNNSDQDNPDQETEDSSDQETQDDEDSSDQETQEMEDSSDPETQEGEDSSDPETQEDENSSVQGNLDQETRKESENSSNQNDLDQETQEKGENSSNKVPETQDGPELWVDESDALSSLRLAYDSDGNTTDIEGESEEVIVLLTSEGWEGAEELLTNEGEISSDELVMDD